MMDGDRVLGPYVSNHLAPHILPACISRWVGGVKLMSSLWYALKLKTCSSFFLFS